MPNAGMKVFAQSEGAQPLNAFWRLRGWEPAWYASVFSIENHSLNSSFTRERWQLSIIL